MTKLKETDMLELPQGAKIKDLSEDVGLSRDICSRALQGLRYNVSVENYTSIRQLAVAKYGAMKKTLSKVEI